MGRRNRKAENGQKEEETIIKGTTEAERAKAKTQKEPRRKRENRFFADEEKG